MVKADLLRELGTQQDIEDYLGNTCMNMHVVLLRCKQHAVFHFENDFLCIDEAKQGRANMLTLPSSLIVSGQSIEPEVYPRPDGSVYICGSPEQIELPLDPNTIQANPESIEDLKEVARSVSTRLADAPLEVGQSCYLPVSEDGVPVMGKVPGVQGAYIASGDSLSNRSCTRIVCRPGSKIVGENQ